ncbi:putative flavoprotein [Halteromyces radiatus]|uniref:putative flavoprotein n=1 Tax=Halteromyces radiatus TaxID=101107 RepID=UPI00221ECF54|nr:putative flavoprotein [Halteromyces radiatus]KAI8076882.1 putative flavoprotein [Halteromyces radiatus]
MVYPVQEDLTALVIGAGFSGICSAIQLYKQLGIVADIIEQASEIGGTWHANTYPGCACDIPSHLYSFSFELNPNWTEHYASQSEIYAYLRQVARKYDLYKNTKLNTSVLKAEWCQDRSQWKVDYCHQDTPDQIQSKYYHFLFSGVGGLRIPKIPDQLKGFTGPTMHTALWDDTVELENKRVALVGNGASAVQVMPYLQKKATRLYNFQRTPGWIAPRSQFKYSKLLMTCLRYIPFLMRFYRWFLYLIREFRIFNFKYPRSSFAKRVRRLFTHSITKRLTDVGRPDLIPLLLPNYAVGCKRICQSEDYYEYIAKDNVTVVGSAVEKVDGNTLWVTTSNGVQQSYEVDVLVLATGFNVHDQFGHLDIIGRNGISLKTLWKQDSPKTYKTVTMHGYPNFFMMLGPGTGLGHNTVVAMIESQVNFAIDCIKKMLRYHLDYIEPKQDAQEKFTLNLHNNLKSTVWLSGGCHSWYQDGKGGSSSLWSGTVTSFWWTLRNTSIDDFIL